MKRLLKKQEQLNYNWQGIMACISICLSIIIYYSVKNTIGSSLASAWLFGLFIGYILQRSRICFTAALRDPFLFGLTKLSRGIILSLMLSTIGFALIQYYYFNNKLPLPGRFLILGIHIPIGAFIFGLGASISGSCASGTIVRIGEGFQLQWVVLLGFVCGSVHGVYDARFWYSLFDEGQILHIPSVFGWFLGVFLQLTLLLILYLLLYFWEKYKFSA